MKKYILVLLGVLSITACSRDDSAQPATINADKVIFGGVYGMCGGDCRDLYLINHEGVYRDSDSESDEYGNWSNTSFGKKVEQEEPGNVEELLEVPSSLYQQGISEEELVQSVADVDYYLYIEKDGKSREFMLDHIHKNASPEIKSYFRVFLETYKGIGGFMIDTTNIERYY